MPYTIRVSTSYGQPPLYIEEFATKEEFLKVSKLVKSEDAPTLISRLVMVPKEERACAQFCSDLFIPTFSDLMKGVDSVAAKILLAPFALWADFSTLLFRIVTLLPRWCSLRTREDHPLHKYLVSKNANQELLNKGHLFVEQELRCTDGKKHEKGTTVFLTKTLQRERRFTEIDTLDPKEKIVSYRGKFYLASKFINPARA